MCAELAVAVTPQHRHYLRCCSLPTHWPVAFFYYFSSSLCAVLSMTIFQIVLPCTALMDELKKQVLLSTKDIAKKLLVVPELSVWPTMRGKKELHRRRHATAPVSTAETAVLFSLLFSYFTLYTEAPDSASPLRTSTLCEYESASNDTSRDAESGASCLRV